MNPRLILALAGLAALWLSMLLLGAGEVDRSILLALYARDEPLLAFLAQWLTRLGDWGSVVIFTLLCAAWLAYRQEVRNALLLLVITFGGRLIVLLAKAYFDRLRPEEHMRLVEVHYQSFPSGHAANSMMVYLAAALLLFDHPPHRRIAAGAAVLLSLLVGLSRPLLGVHWPSDVIGGWAFGLFWVLLCLQVAQTLKRNSSTSPSWTT